MKKHEEAGTVLKEGRRNRAALDIISLTGSEGSAKLIGVKLDPSSLKKARIDVHPARAGRESTNSRSDGTGMKSCSRRRRTVIAISSVVFVVLAVVMCRVLLDDRPSRNPFRVDSPGPNGRAVWDLLEQVAQLRTDHIRQVEDVIGSPLERDWLDAVVREELEQCKAELDDLSSMLGRIVSHTEYECGLDPIDPEIGSVLFSYRSLCRVLLARCVLDGDFSDALAIANAQQHVGELLQSCPGGAVEFGQGVGFVMTAEQTRLVIARDLGVELAQAFDSRDFMTDVDVTPMAAAEFALATKALDSWSSPPEYSKSRYRSLPRFLTYKPQRTRNLTIAMMQRAIEAYQSNRSLPEVSVSPPSALSVLLNGNAMGQQIVALQEAAFLGVLSRVRRLSNVRRLAGVAARVKSWELSTGRTLQSLSELPLELESNKWSIDTDRRTIEYSEVDNRVAEY